MFIICSNLEIGFTLVKQAEMTKNDKNKSATYAISVTVEVNNNIKNITNTISTFDLVT